MFGRAPAPEPPAAAARTESPRPLRLCVGPTGARAVCGGGGLRRRGAALVVAYTTVMLCDSAHNSAAQTSGGPGRLLKKISLWAPRPAAGLRRSVLHVSSGTLEVLHARDRGRATGRPVVIFKRVVVLHVISFTPGRPVLPGRLVYG